MTRKSKHILVVEDNPLTSRYLTDVLNECGYTTRTAVSGSEAMEKVCQSRVADLILMDIELAGDVDGIDAARRILQLFDIPIVFLTANSSAKIHEKIKSVNGYGFVAKGTDKYALLSMIEMALRLHEANSYSNLYRQIIENSLNEIYILDPQTLQFIMVNRGVRENLGYSMSEMAKKTPSDVTLGFTKEKFQKIIEPLRKQNHSNIKFKACNIRKDGSLYPIEVHLQKLSYHEDEVYLAIVFDMTEYSKMEEVLRIREERLKTVTETANDAIIMIDEQGNTCFWNLAAEKLFGYTWEEVRGKNLHSLLMPKAGYRKREKKFRQWNFSEKGKFIKKTVEMKAKHKNDSLLDVEISVNSFQNDVGWNAVAVVREIGDRKKLEKENAIKTEQIRLMIEGIPSPAWLISKERRILAYNKVAGELFTAKIDDYCWQGIHQGECLPDAKKAKYKKTTGCLVGAKCHFCQADEAFDKKAPVNKEVNFAGGTWDTWWVPLGEDVYLHFANDVTKYKKMEEELRQLSIKDSLTNAYNLRYFISKMEDEIARAKRSRREFSLIMLDVDHFKSINDLYGHNVGDLVLKNLTEMIKNRLRKMDILARWGGEEFVILLPETNAANASILAEEIRKKLVKMDTNGVSNISASFGVVVYCPGDSVNTLLKKADEMMYRAKKAGRNMVCYDEDTAFKQTK